MSALYIHIPFCERKCFYCSFVVSVGQEKRIDEYLDCLSKEAQMYQERQVRTIYIGGGTPTILNENQLNELFRIIQKNFIFNGKNELTIEANPETIDLTKARLLKNLGVNRISLGIQSLNDRYLTYLGRNHNRAKACESFALLRRAGFNNINVDLMFDFPQESLEELRQDIKDFISLGSDHISAYSLTIEEPSRFFVKSIQPLDPQKQSEHYLFLINELEAAGFKQYEISNFAKPNKESMHNINYWKCGDYIGLGVGAHSHHDGKRSWNVSKLIKYIGFIKFQRSPVAGSEQLKKMERLMEVLLFGLRMNDGVDMSDLEQRLGSFLNDPKERLIHELIKEKYLFLKDNRLKVRRKGQLVLDEISARLF